MKATKVIPTLLLSSLLVFGVTGCGFLSEDTKQSISAVSDVVQKETNIDPSKIADIASTFNFDSVLTNSSSEILKTILAKLNYKVLDFTEDGDKAVVTLQITTIDSKQLVEGVYAQVSQQGLSGLINTANLTETEMIVQAGQILIDSLSNGTITPVTKVITVDLIRVGDTWQLDANAILSKILLGL